MSTYISKANKSFNVILLKKQTLLLFQVCVNNHWHLFVVNVQNSENIVLTSIDKLNLRTDTIVIWFDKTKPVNVIGLIHYYFTHLLNIRAIHSMQKG
jgi:hypothetical protein